MLSVELLGTDELPFTVIAAVWSVEAVVTAARRCSQVSYHWSHCVKVLAVLTVSPLFLLTWWWGTEHLRWHGDGQLGESWCARRW